MGLVVLPLIQLQTFISSFRSWWQQVGGGHVVLEVGGALGAPLGWCGLTVVMVGGVEVRGGGRRWCSCQPVGRILGYLLWGEGSVNGRVEWRLGGPTRLVRCLLASIYT